MLIYLVLFITKPELFYIFNYKDIYLIVETQKHLYNNLEKFVYLIWPPFIFLNIKFCLI